MGKEDIGGAVEQGIRPKMQPGSVNSFFLGSTTIFINQLGLHDFNFYKD